jgi:hypothetical protein
MWLVRSSSLFGSFALHEVGKPLLRQFNLPPG